MKSVEKVIKDRIFRIESNNLNVIKYEIQDTHKN
jgi:hypothetical protein